MHFRKKIYYKSEGNMKAKIVLIVLLVAVLSAIHLSYNGGQPDFHILHQQLFFIPLVLASFWFGILPGLLVAVSISLLYGPAMILRHSEQEMHLIVYAQVSLYLFVALMIGWLSDRQRRQQEQLLKGERITAMAKAASTLSFEILDIIKSAEGIYRTSGGLKEPSSNDDFLSEVLRLRRLIEALGRFGPSLDHLSLSTDLNDILQHSFSKFREEASRKGLKLILREDKDGCPSMLPQEEITRVYDSLISNAIDFSKRGKSIILQSERGGQECVLKVIDFGKGVAKEHESKLFSVFFTTKPDGYSLSLSSGKKAMQGLGGDLIYEAGESKGTIFTVIVPREKRDESIEDFAANRI